MINRNDMMEVLLTACPSFAPVWQEFLAEWQDDPGELPLYLALADFARHLIDMLQWGDTSRFPIIFEAIESLHKNGDPHVREAATIGILESLQNTSLHASTHPEQFRPFLGPESQRWWDRL